VSGLAQAFPAQHGCPSPPQVTQLDDPHVLPDGHVMQTVPPRPHASSLAPLSHVVPEQHPEHDVASQAQTPLRQCCPVPHEPAGHTPPHPSSAPQGLPLQLGVQLHIVSHWHAPATHC